MVRHRLLKETRSMPLTHVTMRAGKSQAYRDAVLDSLYLAMRETFDVPEDDRFMSISEHEAGNFAYGKSYLGIARDDDLLLIQITVSNTRTVEKKKALFARIAARLTENPGVRPENIFINLVEVQKENWSFGHGLAQYA
jgi:4-oxalocrotonate tautomerase